MRWLCVLLLMIIWALLPIPVFAQTSDTVTVTVAGFVVEAPGGLTLTYISDYEIGISWVKGATANNTMIRVKVGEMPSDREDGYLVYYGQGTNHSDTNVDIAGTTQILYYRAWSQNYDGYWESTGIWEEANFMSLSWLFAGLALIAVGLTCTMFITRQMMLGYASALFWAIFGVFNYLQSETAWGDIYYFVFFASTFGMTVFCIIAAYGLRERRDTIADEQMEEGEGRYIDEGEGESGLAFHSREENANMSKRTRDLRERAAKRRTRL